MLDLDEDLIYRMFPTLQGVTFAVLPQSYSKIFDAPGAAPVVEHFQASRGQFKWRRFARQARQAATVVGVIALGLIAWWLSSRVMITWRS
jgi:hypothetical protein